MSNASSNKDKPVEPTDGVTWGPGSAIIVAVGGYVASTLVAGIILSLIPMLLGHNGQQFSTWLEHSIVAQFLFVLLFETLTVGILVWYLRRKHAKFAVLGLTRPRIRDVGWMVAGFCIYFLPFICISGILSQLGWLDLSQRQELPFSDDNTVGYAALAIVFFSLVILPPLVEETLFRGFLFSGLRKRLTVVTATIVTSVLFALPHMLQNEHGILWIAGLDTFILSLALCWLRVKTGNLWAGIGVHALKNGLAFVSLFILHLK